MRRSVKLDGTVRSANQVFKAYNEAYFDGKLNPDIRVRFGKTSKDGLGVYSMFMESDADRDLFKLEHEIVLDPILKKLHRVMCIVLLHEMCHTRHPRNQHGRKFQAERRRLMSLGAYDDLL